MLNSNFRQFNINKNQDVNRFSLNLMGGHLNERNKNNPADNSTIRKNLR
jgi:hypothetical protein